MQKKLIALAVASVVSAPVFAQSQVSVYGVIDVGIESAKFNDNDGNITRMFNSGNTTNRLGFKGSEDLGNGMKANFMLETQPEPDVGAAPANTSFWGRTATVGLSSSSWGSVNLGSQYTPWFSARAANDIFYTAGSGSNYLLEGSLTRMSNSIRYDSPSFNGFTVAVMYGMGETTGLTTIVAGGPNPYGAPVGTTLATASYNSQEGLTDATKDVGRSAGLNLAYANGPLALRYGYNDQRVADVVGGPSVNQTLNTLNGSYDFKVAKLVAGWSSNKVDQDIQDTRAWYIGGVMPVFGKDLVKLEYTRLNDKLNDSADSRLIALGYEHMMSKRTVLYATYAKMNNDSLVNRSFLTGGGAVTAGFDPSSFQMGLKHSF